MGAVGRGANPRKSLIIVCCHAIYLPDPSPSHPEQARDERNWLLADFQRSRAGKEGEHLTFIRHLLRARDLARTSPHVNVVVSGGATKPETNKSEAQGYLDALATMASPGSAWLVEGDATDTFQNVLFSILRHRQVEASWPSQITVVTHGFKTARIKQHLKALRWPETGSRIEGIDPPFAQAERRAVESSEQRCLDEWKADLYGVRPALSGKRTRRLWRPCSELFDRMTCDMAVRRLLEWDGGDDPSQEFPQRLPWEEAE